jgi:tRNA G10  N-methylase Trm11
MVVLGSPRTEPARYIKLHRLKKGLVVLKPFLGSGTTLVAAESLGCSGIGVALDEHYAKVARKVREYICCSVMLRLSGSRGGHGKEV